MIVIDSSALVAIFMREPEQASYLAALRTAMDTRLSAGTLVEAGIVLGGRGAVGLEGVGALLRRVNAIVEPVTEARARAATAAWYRFGKGRHAAALNYGDCFAYALAKELDAPLLFKGNDFALTDIRSAL